jgi:HEAT repeat protein
MNCQDIQLLLNDSDTQRLTAAKQAAVAGHLQVCPACAGDWNAHEWLRNRRVAPMAEGLRQRLWQRLDIGARQKRSGRGLGRTVIFGGVIVAAAAAMLVSMMSERTDPDDAARRSPITLTGDVAASAEGPVPVAPTTASAPDQGATENPGASLAAARPARVVVLPLRHENSSATAIAMSEVYFAAILDALRAFPELELVLLSDADVAAVDLTAATAAGSYRIGRAVADHYGADGAISGANESGMLFRLLGLPDRFSWRLKIEGQARGSLSVYGLRRPAEDSARFEQDVQRVARGLRDLLARPEAREALFAAAQAAFLDISRSDNDRLTTLNEFQMNRMRAGRFMEPLPETMVSAMIELGSTSTSPVVRGQVWRVVQTMPEAGFRDALLQALLYDPSEQVRREAASALAEYPDATAATREILALESNAELRAEQAFRDDWQALDTDAQYAYVVAALLDTDLTDAARVAAFDQGLRMATSSDFVERLRSDEQVLAALGEIGESAAETRVRVAALRELAKSGHPDFMGLFVQHLGADQPLELRLTAANAMWEHYADNPEAREALRRIREE